MRTRIAVLGIAMVVAGSVQWAAWGVEAEESSAGVRAAVVLDTAGFWRMHHTLKGPVLEAGGNLKPFPYYEGKPKGQEGQILMWHGLLAGETAGPAADWTKADFDDSSWVRGPAVRACRTPYLARLCLRGKFTVTDPARVQGLALSVSYHGGAAVYLNGQEIARQHLAAGAALAEAYPVEAFVDEDGKLITVRGDEALWRQKPSAEVTKRIEGRERRLSVPLPGKALRRGVNVVAIELVRSPYDKVIEEQIATSDNHGTHRAFEATWNTCEIRQVQVTAGSGDAVVPNATRPAGFQVWNSDPSATDYDMDFGDQAEELRPISLVGARNGAYSGKVVVGSDKPIRGLAATAAELKGPGGTIPAANVRLRYAAPWGAVALTSADNNEVIPYPAEPTPLLALWDAAPQEVAVWKKQVTPRCLKLPGQPEPVFGAVAAVWVTVKVPKGARPGNYTGQVVVRAEGMNAVTVPVSVKVVDWALPDAAESRTWVELIQSPDTLAVQYGLPLWSEPHWEKIGKSLSFVGEMGSRVLYVPLIAQSNAGNEESMVRWIRKGEDRYEHDFSIMEKYLDVAEKQIGMPAVVVFNAWDRYLMRKGAGGRGFWIESSLKIAAKGPLVTMVDRASGKAETVSLPDYTDPSSKGLWKPLFDGLRERMRKRGLEEAMHLGMVSDFWATREEVEFLKEVSGDLPWANAGHYTRKTLYEGLAKFGYQSSYFGTAFGYGKSLHGWKSPDSYLLFERVGLDGYPLVKWRNLPEQSITGSVRGVGRLGADTWPVVKDKQGVRRARAWERYPGADWGYLNANCAALAAGPDGPVATSRFEALREGRQECEALIVLERALTDKALTDRLGLELAQSCQAALDERRQVMWRSMGIWQLGPKYSHELTSWRERAVDTGYTWFLGSGWQERSEKLYALAGEVAKKLAGS